MQSPAEVFAAIENLKIKSNFVTDVKAKYDQLFEEGIAIQKRWGLPQDVGKTVGSLVDQDLPYSTGQVLMVDGGLTIERL